MKSRKQNVFTPTIVSPHKIDRRSLLKLGVGAGLLPLAAGVRAEPGVARQYATPRQTEGPFYPVNEQKDKDVDLTLIEGKGERAQGKVVHVRGRVFDMEGVPLEDAFVEIWQANTWGRYRHFRDPNRAPLDPNFQGWGQTHTDAAGRYGFKTIMPGAYPAGPGWTRPPHIHFKIAKQGYSPLTTQMYFPGERLNDIDGILQNLPAPLQKMVISQREEASDTNDPVYVFDIILRAS
jgi:protocatechuate 3,4-dioxygenase beta subunit